MTKLKDKELYAALGWLARENKITFELFLDTEPDFFACHSIEVFITAAPERTYRIKVNGLAG